MLLDLLRLSRAVGEASSVKLSGKLCWGWGLHSAESEYQETDREIIFEEFQPVWSVIILHSRSNVTDGEKDGHATCHMNTVLCECVASRCTKQHN